MRLKQELAPQLTKKNETDYLISFWYNGKRYRFSNGQPIDIDISPNTYPVHQRKRQAEVLCSAYTMAIRDGWRPEKKSDNVIVPIKSIAKNTLTSKLLMDYSSSYKKDLAYTERLWSQFIIERGISEQPMGTLKVEDVRDFIFQCSPSTASMANWKRNISALLKDELESNGIPLNLRKIKLPKQAQELHRPIEDLTAVLTEIKGYNSNLHLCCLMTYSMLLRPHREIRCLRFSDFKNDFSILSLNGNRVKSKRNRIVPVPEAVKQELASRFGTVDDREANIFSLQPHEHNNSYFKGLWSKYKKRSTLLTHNHTLYSFRHTGAIKVFEKTGSLQKLQQVMGHSDMKVSLTYLRGLEVKQLDVEDLPDLN
jgi:integrase